MDCGSDEQTKQNGGHGGAGDDPAEWKKVAELRAVVEAQDPASKEEDDFMLRRFLRARDHNIGKASAMFLKYLSWKRTAKPRGDITDDEVRNELAQEKLYMQGHDKEGRPMVYVLGARHLPSRRDLDEFKRFVAYVIDRTCTRLPAGQEKFAAVADLKGWGYANCDIRAYVAALDIMQSCYPERLGRVFLIHVPRVFMAAWRMVYPFIDEKTKRKFVFVPDSDLDATLRDAVDESQLPEQYGGKLKLQGLPAGQEKFAAVADLKGWGYANCDIRAYVAALDIMQSCYPERLGRVFMAAWRMVYPFIDDKTKKKFVFVPDSDLDATLRDAVDESQLPEQYGGKLKLQGYAARSSTTATPN